MKSFFQGIVDLRRHGDFARIGQVCQAIRDEGPYIAERMQCPPKVTSVMNQRVLGCAENKR